MTLPPHSSPQPPQLMAHAVQTTYEPANQFPVSQVSSDNHIIQPTFLEVAQPQQIIYTIPTTQQSPKINYGPHVVSTIQEMSGKHHPTYVTNYFPTLTTNPPPQSPNIQHIQTGSNYVYPIQPNYYHHY